MRDIIKSQLLAAVCPLHEHPELGFVQASIQTVEKRLLDMPLKRVLTWAAGSLPLHGNMQTSVVSPAALAFCRLEAALVSRIPLDLNALMMAQEYPAFLKQVKVEAEEAAKRSTPRAANPTVTRLQIMMRDKIFIFNKKSIYFHILHALIRMAKQQQVL